MGLDLTLLPVESEDVGFSHTTLMCERRHKLFTEISAVERREGLSVPKHFGTYLCRDDRYEEPHYGNTQRTPYNDPLKRMNVKHLLALQDHVGVVDNFTNRAIWAYLRELPPTMDIALYWH